MATEKEIRDQERLNRLRNQLSDTDRQIVDGQKNINDQLRVAESLYEKQDRITNNIYNNLTGIVGELTKERSSRTQINRSARELLGISNKLLNYEQGIEKLSSKQIGREIEKANIATASLKRLQGQSKYAKENEGNISTIIRLQDQFNSQLSYAQEEAKAVEDALGLTGGVLKTLVNTPGLSSFAALFRVDEAVEEMERFSRAQIEALKQTDEYAPRYAKLQKDVTKISDEIGENTRLLQEGNLNERQKEKIKKRILYLQEEEQKKLTEIGKLNAKVTKDATGFVGKMRVGLKGLGSVIANLSKSLFSPAVLFAALLKSAGSVNQQIVGLSKNLGLAYEEAQLVRTQFADYADSLEDSFYSTKKLIAAQMAFNEALGIQGRIIKENAKEFVDLTQRLGIASESAAKLQLFAEATGVEFEKQTHQAYETANSVEQQFGVHLNMKQVMDAVGRAGAYALVQHRGSVESLTQSVAQAKALGLELSDVNQIAGQLLDFESSISNELQAELLTGRAINLERARFAALNNDQQTLMSEINKEMGDFNDFQNLNRIQQEAFASSLGLSVDKLSDMLLLEEYRGQTAEMIEQKAGSEIAKRVEMLTTQERFNGAIEKLQDILINLVEGPLGTMAHLFSEVLGSSTAMYGIIGGLAAGPIVSMIRGFKTILPIIKAIRIQSIATAISSIFTGAASLGPLGIAAAGVAVGGLIGLIKTHSKADDMISPGYGSRMIMSPEGTIALNNKDTIVAGTNLNQGSSGGADPMMANEMRRTNQILSQILNKEGTVNIDSSTAGRAFTMGTYAMQ